MAGAKAVSSGIATSSRRKNMCLGRFTNFNYSFYLIIEAMFPRSRQGIPLPCRSIRPTYPPQRFRLLVDGVFCVRAPGGYSVLRFLSLIPRLPSNRIVLSRGFLIVPSRGLLKVPSRADFSVPSRDFLEVPSRGLLSVPSRGFIRVPSRGLLSVPSRGFPSIPSRGFPSVPSRAFPSVPSRGRLDIWSPTS